MIERIATTWTWIIDRLTDAALAPAAAALGSHAARGDIREIAEALAIGAVQIAIIACLFRPLESIAPAERWTDRKLTGVDRFATLLMVLGILPLFSFLVLLPVGHAIAGGGGAAAETGLKHWLPALAERPLLAFAIYYVIYDLAYYWMHRAQHAIPWWWALHSMHHSQRQMSCWTNDRGSYIDAALQAAIFATLGIVLGTEPSEFALLQLLSELVQNLSHANVLLGFGRLGERLLVDPPFHRLHHMKVDPARPGLHDCNFGQVLPWWDQLFGTALYGEPVRATGVGDPTVDADNGRSYFAMQWWTCKRFWGAVTRASGWRPHEVAFNERFEPVAVCHGVSPAPSDPEPASRLRQAASRMTGPPIAD